MSERLPSESRDIDRIEVDVLPFIAADGSQERYSALMKRVNVELGKRGVYVALFLGGKSVGTDTDAQSFRRVFDEEHINNAILEARRRTRLIDDAAARVIASQLHGGQSSALYALASSGAIEPGLLEEIDREAQNPQLDPLARSWAVSLEQYAMVRIQNNKWGAVKGWNQLWLGEHDEAGLTTSAWTDEGDWPLSELPPVLRAQRLYDEDATYQRFAEEFTKEELIELWKLCGDGTTYSFDDEVYDALAQKYDYFGEGQ